MRDAVFRQAIRGDVAAIVILLADDALGREREVVADPPDPAYLAAFDAVSSNPHDHLVVAEAERAIVGCAQLTVLHGLSRQGTRRGLIEGVRVASSWRGTGLGAALIEHLVGLAREAGCGLVQLTTDASRVRAQSFYTRLGFKPTHVGMKRDLH